MRIGSVASGSSGNCIYVGHDETHLLVDVGISGKRIREGLLEHGIPMESIEGILITHEHIDHIAGLGVLSRKYHIPIYATPGTIRGILATKSVGVIDESLFRILQVGEIVQIGSIEIKPIKISHDAREPVAFRLETNAKKLAILTDLGYYDAEIIQQLQELDGILIESNHDENMVQVGSYPYQLKRRILGNRGHLSNVSAGQLLNEIITDHMKCIILGHLSGENNLPELAYETVRMELTMGENAYTGMEYPIQVANRSCITQMIEI